jgi:hypothetical protein
MATEDFSRIVDAAGELESQARAFSDLGRSLTEALEQARLQASEIIGRAQDHSNLVVKSTDRRLAEALRQATTAERRAVAARDQLAGLDGLIEQAQARLAHIRTNALEISRLATTTELAPATEEPLLSSSHTQLENAASTTEHAEAQNGPDGDPLAALASLRAAVDASR